MSLKRRYANGEETRRRIIDTAVDIFGCKGFADTSTRDSAAAAGVNISAIQYYFGSKQGLYTACIDQLVNRVWTRIGPTIETCDAVLSAKAMLCEIIVLASAVQNCLIDSFFAGSNGLAIRRLMAWAEAENNKNVPSESIKNRIVLPLIETFRKIAEYVSPVQMESISTDLYANALLGTSMIFHLDRTLFIEVLDCNETFIFTFKSIAQTYLAFALTGLSEISLDGYRRQACA